MPVTYDRFKLTLTGAASYGFGGRTFRRGVTVETSDPVLIDWVQKTGRFRIEPVLEAERKPDPKAPEAESDPEPEAPAPPVEPAPKPARSWTDDVLEALLGEPIKDIVPRLDGMTVADLRRLRELEDARPDTRKTLLEEIDQELRKKG